MSEVCKSCHQPIPEPKNEWLTTEEVVEKFKFDPNAYIVGDQKVASKLVPVKCGSCNGMRRVWLKADIEYRAQKLST